MCILLLSTSHPKYALVLISNRDEYVLRPTSRPSWWKAAGGGEILSSCDLERPERGAWLGLTRSGRLAALTNYREKARDGSHPVHAARSRGSMVTAWLTDDGDIDEGVRRLVEGGLAGVGGFSMVCGKLGGPMAVVSNRARRPDDVPLIGLERGETWGLSNTVFDDPDEWPKVKMGEHLLNKVVSEAAANDASQDELLRGLFTVLDTDTLPRDDGMGLEEYISQLRHTIFVPAIGNEAHRRAMREATAKGPGDWAALTGDAEVVETLLTEQRPDANPGADTTAFETGMYGTQRQTIVLVDLAGRVTLVERALWDSNGNAIPRGQGDVVFRFEIEGWDQ